MKLEDSTSSKLAIGSVQFGLDYGISNQEGKTSPAEVGQILKRASENGISLIDTAYAYGESEMVLGQNDLSSFQLVSKFPACPTHPLRNLLEASLDRLEVESIYGYMAHRAEDLIEKPSLWEELRELKSDGRVYKIGCSLYRPETLQCLWEKGFHPEIIQIPFNVFDQRFQHLLLRIKDTGCEIHARSAFLQGIFFIDPRNLDSFFDPLKEPIRNIQTRFPNAADRAAQLVHFCLKNPLIDRVIIGVISANQLDENLRALWSNNISNLEPQEFTEELLMPHLWPKGI